MNTVFFTRKLIVLIAIIFLTSCGGKNVKVNKPIEGQAAISAKLEEKAETLPTKPQPTLTSEQIRQLDIAEEQEAARLFLEIKKKERARLELQPKVTNLFTEADLRQVLLDFATQAGINIIVDESVQGTISASFENVPLEVALSQVLSAGGFKFRCVESGSHVYYLVGLPIPENPNFNELSATRVIKTNQEAVKVAEQISDFYKPYVFPSKTGNTLTITGPGEILDRLEWDIALIDRTKRQIEISARFVMVQWEEGSNLGMQWGDINLDASGLGDFLKGSVPMFSGNIAAGLSNLLSINGYKAKVDIIAEPRITIEDGSEGKLKITREDLFLILSGGGSYYNYFTTKDVSTGVILDVQPFITRDGMLRLIIEPEISDIIAEREFKMSGTGGNGSIGQKLPVIARRGATTTVKIENGKTVAIGGLLMQEKREKNKGVPKLSEMPIIGHFLGSEEDSSKDSELVIFITPRVVG